MNYSRAFKAATTVWIIGVMVFLTGSLLPLSNDPKLQANLTLAIAFIPLGWLGARYYYKKDTLTPAYQLALIMGLMTALLDAIITVPIFFMPVGISHVEFFTEPGFWLLMSEYVGVVLLYGFVRKRKALLTV